MSRAKQLSQRRSMLMAECAMQRSMLIAQGREFAENTGLIQSGEGIAARFKSLPGWASVLLAVGVILMPGRVARLTRSGLMLWQLWRNLKASTNSTD